MVRSLLLLAACGCIAGCNPAFAQKPPLQLAEGYLKADDPTVADQKIVEQLAAETKMQFIDTPLEEVAAYLSTLHGIDVQIDGKSLEDVGVSPEIPVTLNVENVSLRSGLRLMLSQLELTYVVDHGRLLILTPEAAEGEKYTKAVFDPCADLIYPEGPNYNSAAQPDYDALIHVIGSSIEPESWGEVGGPQQDIYPLENGLVIKQTEQVQTKIAALLAALRVAKALPDDAYDPTAIQVDTAPFVTSAELQASLEKKGKHVFDKMPLEEFAAFLQQMTGSQVLLDKRALEDIGVSPDLPITVNLGSASALDLLRFLEREHDLTYVLQHDVVLITTSESAESDLLVKVYPVRDLIEPRGADRKVERIWSSGNRRIQAGYAFKRDEPDYDSLIATISASLDFESWESMGGPGVIVPFENTDALVIAQTERVHEQIAQLLRDVRRNRQPRPASTPEAEAKLKAPVLQRYPIPLESETDAEIKALATLLRSEVAPSNWNDPACYIKTLGSKDLLIKQTPAMHAEVRGWLDQLYPDAGYQNPSVPNDTPGRGVPQSGFGGGGGGFGGGGGGGFGGGGEGGFFQLPADRAALPSQ